MLALQAVTPEALAGALQITVPEARKIVSAVHRGQLPLSSAPLAGVRRTAINAACALGHVPALEVRSVQRSALDPFVKLALTTADGHVVETVRIPLERAGRFSACVSSQAGCALACV
ncbi:MAG TPA: RNA methyltransferase, partial [Polyangiaceae bacterium]|nr:RNA methyltransferase [Polyangiaceae bacterium]